MYRAGPVESVSAEWLYSTCTFVMETVEEEERVDEGME